MLSIVNFFAPLLKKRERVTEATLEGGKTERGNSRGYKKRAGKKPRRTRAGVEWLSKVSRKQKGIERGKIGDEYSSMVEGVENVRLPADGMFGNKFSHSTNGPRGMAGKGLVRPIEGTLQTAQASPLARVSGLRAIRDDILLRLEQRTTRRGRMSTTSIMTRADNPFSPLSPGKTFKMEAVNACNTLFKQRPKGNCCLTSRPLANVCSHPRVTFVSGETIG